MGKTGNGNMAQSEESMTLMTSYRFPHYDALPSPVILNGGKNTLWERRKTEQ